MALAAYDWSSLGIGRHAEAVKAWVAKLCPIDLQCKSLVARLSRAVGDVVDRAARHDQQAASRRWLIWLNEGPGRGLGRQHRMSRCATGFIRAKSVLTDALSQEPHDLDSEDDVEGISEGDYEIEVCSSCPMNKQQSVDHEAEVWADIWHEGLTEFATQWPEVLGARLPPITVATFREACNTFRNAVGLGWDKMHPKALARCSDFAIRCIICMLAMAEKLGRWPESIGVILVVLIPKSDGGRRPIGLFPTLIRVWMKTRLAIAQEWVAANEREYLYAGPGKGAEVAAWKQGMLAEAAKSIEASYASSLLDLVRAFDSVPFDWLLRQAIRYGYNLWLLRLSVQSYLLGRVLVIDGCCSRVVIATRGLTAGSVLATIELRILLVEWADRAVAMTIFTRLTVYVDDATIETIGTRRLIEKHHAEVVNAFTTDLRLMRLEFSPTKNVTTASSEALASRVCKDIKGIVMKYANRCVSLGSGLGAGTRRNTQQTLKRLKAFKSRVPRFKALKRARVDTARLLRTGGNAAMLFGGRVMGTSTSFWRSRGEQRRLPPVTGPVEQTLTSRWSSLMGPPLVVPTRPLRHTLG